MPNIELTCKCGRVLVTTLDVKIWKNFKERVKACPECETPIDVIDALVSETVSEPIIVGGQTVGMKIKRTDLIGKMPEDFEF